MNSSEWQQIKEIFNTVIDLPDDERAEFWEKLDENILQKVKNLIKANDDANNFIVEPAFVDVGLVDENETDLYVGKQIGDYKILDEIGQGGMGTVYLAVKADESYNKKVAIKLIKRGMDTAAVLKRFVMERQILAQLENPNIASLLDGGSTADGLPYLVMEYIEGVPVTKFCDLHELSIKERLELFRKICAAVSYAHQNLVIHRDLKPSNILVTTDGIPKLLDFGIAKLLNPDWSLETDEATATAFRLMTPEYASPEQIRGLPITTASDVYSLGVVLYELLSGERPYKIESRLPQELAQVVLTDEPVRPSEVATRRRGDAKTRSEFSASTDSEDKPTISASLRLRVTAAQLKGDLDNIILKALRKERERRYQSVQEFSEDIRRHLVGLPVTATADTPFYRIGKFIKRHRSGVLASILMLFTILLATTITTWQAIVAKREQAKAEQRFNDVRQLAHSVVFEFHDSIQNLPGATPARELMVSRALEYLDRLASEAGQDNSLQLELAEAYDKIGDIQGGWSTAHLGQRKNAHESYRKALTIRESLVAAEPDNVDFRRKLSFSYRKLGEISWVEVDIIGALEFYRQAFLINQKLADELPNDAGIRFDLAYSYKNFGHMLAANGQTDKGLENTRQAVILFEELALADPDNIKIQAALAVSYDRVAEIHQSVTQNYSEALLLYRKSQIISDKLVADDSLNTRFRRSQAVSFYNIADVTANLGDPQTALESSRKSLAIFTEMSAADPQNEDLRETAVAIQTLVCRLMIKTGNAAEAVNLLNQSLITLEKLFAASPTDGIVHFRIAVLQQELGNGFAALAAESKTSPPKRLAKWREARSWFQKSAEIYKVFRDAGKSTGEEGTRLDVVTGEITKCDNAIAQLTSK